jgi:ribosomal protein L11 methyltransferase
MLLELVPEGFEEIDRGLEVELVAYVDAGRHELLRRVFSDAEASDVPPGYADAWRAFHRPLRVGPLWVGPPWEVPEPEAIAVVIDPGQAFGTGAHATTRLCLELLLERPPGSVVDLGCGSGVLAIAAARLGHDPVVALDSDEAAVAATRGNAAANRAEIDVRCADVLVDPLPTASLALANLELRSVETVAQRVRAGALVVSGILDRDHPVLGGRWCLSERHELDGWAAELHERR